MDYQSSPRHIRETYCWDCKQPISNADAPECPACGWIICPNCGACRQFGCVSVAFIERPYRKVLRDIWISLPDPKPSSVEDWAIETASEIREQEKRKAAEQKLILLGTYRKRLSSGEQVFHSLYGYGQPVKMIKQGKQKKLIVVFSSCGEKRFNIPESFLQGGLVFAADIEQ